MLAQDNYGNYGAYTTVGVTTPNRGAGERHILGRHRVRVRVTGCIAAGNDDDAGTSCAAHEKTGVAHQRRDSLGRSVKTEASSATGYTLPTQIRPNDSSWLATSIGYNGRLR